MTLTPSMAETMAVAGLQVGMTEQQVVDQIEYTAKVQGWKSKNKLPGTVARAAYNTAKVKQQNRS